MKYSGSCHCQAVRFEVELDLKEVMSCNCSICSRKGTLMSFTGIDNFKLLTKDDSMSDYVFNKHVIHHLFCKTCGIHAYGTGTAPNGEKMISVNARCLENVDLSSIPVKTFDGKSK